MKKKVFAVVALLAPPLAAQAQTANVTLYGRVNLNLEFINGKQTPVCNPPGGADCYQPNPTVSRVSSNTSRFGIRGVEPLGGGLNAIFQIESNVQADTGNSSATGLASRETFVGLQGSWGRFTMGKFFMPIDELHPMFGNAPTFTTSILSTLALWTNTSGSASQFAGSLDARVGNSLRYDSPNWSGFSFATQIALRDSSGNPDNIGPCANPPGTATGGDNGEHCGEVRHAYVFGINSLYSNGPVQAGIAYEKNNKVRNYSVPNGTLNANDWDISVAGAYDFGVVRPAFIYEHIEYEVPPAGATTSSSMAKLTRNFWGVSVTAPMGPGKLYGFFGDALSGNGSAPIGSRVNGLTKGPDTKAQQWEISYTYSMSPRTALYAGYVKINNERNAAYTFNINAYPISTTCNGSGSAADLACGANGKPGGLVFGMMHIF